MKELFDFKCTVREGGIETYDAEKLAAASAVMPTGEPIFVDNSAGYRDDRRGTCMAALNSAYEKFPQLEDAAFHQLGKKQIQLIQESPALVQREWYLDDDDDDENGTSLKEYKELCEESGGAFSIFSGTLDCLGFGENNKGEKVTTVEENAATCFPPTGCSGYTVEEWRIDEMMSLASQSCSVRSSRPSAQASSVSIAEEGDDGSAMIPPWLIVGLVTLVAPVAVLISHCQNEHHEHQKLGECELTLCSLASGYQDDDNLPPMAEDQAATPPHLC